MIDFYEINPETVCWHSLIKESLTTGQKDEAIKFFRWYLARSIRRDKEELKNMARQVAASWAAEELHEKALRALHFRKQRGCL